MCVCVNIHIYTHTHRCIEMVSVRSAVDFQCLLHLVCSGWMLWSRQACNYVTTSWQPDPTSLFYFIFCLFCNDLTVRGLRQTTVSQASPFPSKMAIIHLYCPQRNRLHHKYKSVFVRETLSKWKRKERQQGHWRKFPFCSIVRSNFSWIRKAYSGALG